MACDAPMNKYGGVWGPYIPQVNTTTSKCYHVYILYLNDIIEVHCYVLNQILTKY